MDADLLAAQPQAGPDILLKVEYCFNRSVNACRSYSRQGKQVQVVAAELHALSIIRRMTVSHGLAIRTCTQNNYFDHRLVS
jgi:hypothetical protein